MSSYILELVRGQWHIENKTHGVHDVTCYEDRSDEDRPQVRSGYRPHVIAVLRNITIGLLRLAGYGSSGTAYTCAGPRWYCIGKPDGSTPLPAGFAFEVQL
jgi:hypothetical protein